MHNGHRDDRTPEIRGAHLMVRYAHASLVRQQLNMLATDSKTRIGQSTSDSRAD